MLQLNFTLQSRIEVIENVKYSMETNCFTFFKK